MNNNRRKEINKAIDLLTSAKEAWEEAAAIIESCADEEREYYDNMPESLQGSDKGLGAEAAAELLEGVKDKMHEIDIDDMISDLDDSTNQ